MIEKVYHIIDNIDNNNTKKRLDEIKLKIKNNNDAKSLIKRFEEAKELYEKYNYKDDFVKVKSDLIKNELIKEYLDLQNKINLFSVQINSRISKITKGITDKK